MSKLKKKVFGGLGVSGRCQSDMSLIFDGHDTPTPDFSEAVGETEGVVGNVDHHLIIPPNWKGRKARKQTDQPEKGHLIFDASFESGNLGRIDAISDSEYDLFVRPDTCNPKYRLWFHFTVENVKANQRVVFNVVNFSKVKSLYQEGMSPVVKTTTRPKWQRIPSAHINYYRSPPHKDRFVMSFAFAFDRDDDVYHFAYCFPYSYTDLQNYLQDIEGKDLPFFRRDLLTSTLQKRRLDLLTITETANMGVSNRQAIVFITARVHPGETPASYICQGLIDFLLSNDVNARQLRKRYVFKIVPMLNPDGVALGNYRCSLMGFDLNRHWQLPSSWAHPTVHATKNLLLQYDKNPQMDLILYIDLHAHSTKTSGFFYGNVFSKDTKRCERQLVLPILLSKLADDFSLDSTNFNTDSGKSGTSRRTLGASLNVNCLCYTLEVSFFGYRGPHCPKHAPITPFSTNTYQRLGENLGQAILSFSKVESGECSAPDLPRPFHTFVPTRAHSSLPSNGILVSIKNAASSSSSNKKKTAKKKPTVNSSTTNLQFI